jgi:hypothetical protein
MVWMCPPKVQVLKLKSQSHMLMVFRCCTLERNVRSWGWALYRKRKRDLSWHRSPPYHVAQGPHQMPSNAVPCFWDFQPPQLWAKQTCILYELPGLRNFVKATVNSLRCSPSRLSTVLGQRLPELWALSQWKWQALERWVSFSLPHMPELVEKWGSPKSHFPPLTNGKFCLLELPTWQGK